MRCLLALSLSLLLSPLIAAPTTEDNDQSKAELKKLNGAWKVISITFGGKELIEKEAGDTVIFKNGEYEWEKSSGSGKIVSIDPAKKPKEINYETSAGKKTICIYKLEGDTFTDCFSMIDDVRPKEFKSTKDNGVMVIVYKRTKKWD